MTFTTLDPSLTPSVQTNILDNGGFEISQRGTAFVNPNSGIYTVDRWRVDKGATGTPPQMDVIQVASPVDSGGFSVGMNIITTGTGTNISCSLLQFVENYLAYAGKTVTCTFRVKTSLTGFHIELYDGVQPVTFGTNHSGSGNWETISCTRTINANPTSLRIYIGFGSQQPSGTGVSYIDSAMLVVGNQPATFVPLHPAIDLARCQRYYQAGLFETTALGRTGPTTYNMEYATQITTMRTTPTITVSSVSVWEEGSQVNNVGAYTNVVSVAQGGNLYNTTLTVAYGKPIAGSKPSFLSGNWTASADL